MFFKSISDLINYILKNCNKQAIKICKSYKCLNIFNASQGFADLNSFDIFRVYTNIFGKYDQL